MLKSTDDLRIKDIRELRTPAELMQEFPRTDAATRTVLAARHALHNILHGSDDEAIPVTMSRDLAKEFPGVVRYTEIPRVLNGLGISIVSTSKGLLKDADCRRNKAGGELLCNIW